MNNYLDEINNKVKTYNSEILDIIESSKIGDYFSLVKNVCCEISDTVTPFKVIKNVYSLQKLIKEKFEIIKLKKFLEQLKSNSITKQELDKYAQNNLKSKSDIEQEIEKVLYLLNSFIEEEKGEILGNLYVNLIKGNILYTEFQTYSSILNTFILSDALTLKEIIENPPSYQEEYKKYHSIARLESLGLVHRKDNFWRDTKDDLRFEVFEDGLKFYNYGLKDFINNNPNTKQTWSNI